MTYVQQEKFHISCGDTSNDISRGDMEIDKEDKEEYNRKNKKNFSFKGLNEAQSDALMKLRKKYNQ